MSLIPESGKSPGDENGNLFWYSCLENPMDREAWWAAVHGTAKESDTHQLLNSNLPLVAKITMHFSAMYCCLFILICTKWVCIVSSGTRRQCANSCFQRWQLSFMVYFCVPDSTVEHVQIYHFLFLTILGIKYLNLYCFIKGN